ncbi:uncharacterized protein LOC132705441 [Cylas formicarius]|uniref:uncharacterized protein LOC132705441 n=1 Tax=Cylas formicarius TaxID=197179 RepID=UPI0029585F00|nr:uncharacterized protein LOC132705441 [Cylas formicarius]
MVQTHRIETSRNGEAVKRFRRVDCIDCAFSSEFLIIGLNGLDNRKLVLNICSVHQKMELQQDVCILCTAKTKVVVPSQAQDITSIISSVLSEKINLEEFQNVHSSLKVCPLCLQNLLTVKILKEKFNKKLSVAAAECCLCSCSNHLVVPRDWQELDDILENITGLKRGKGSLICLNCIKCLHLLDSIRDNLVKKYVLLSQKSESVRSKIASIKKKHHDGNTFKCINNLDTALKHLTPVKDSKYNCANLDDIKLLKQVAFVKVYSMESRDDTRTSKSKNLHSSLTNHNFFKIKIKPKSKNISVHRRLPPKIDKKLISSDKNLIVRVARMNSNNLDLKTSLDVLKTPTKASRKMMLDKETWYGKKRKSVTFADERNIEIEYRNYEPKRDLEEKGDSTPLKPSLKKSGFNYEYAKSKEFDSDESTEMCSYVEDIKKNIDNIFDSFKADLKTTTKGGNEEKQAIVIHGDNEVVESKENEEEIDKQNLENRSERSLATNKQNEVSDDYLCAINSHKNTESESDKGSIIEEVICVNTNCKPVADKNQFLSTKSVMEDIDKDKENEEEIDKQNLENRSERSLATNKQNEVSDDYLCAINSHKNTESESDKESINEEVICSNTNCNPVADKNQYLSTNSVMEDIEADRIQSCQELSSAVNKGKEIHKKTSDEVKNPGDNVVRTIVDGTLEQQIDSSIANEGAQRNLNNDPNGDDKRKFETSDEEKLDSSPKRIKFSDGQGNEDKLIDFEVTDTITPKPQNEQPDSRDV